MARARSCGCIHVWRGLHRRYAGGAVSNLPAIVTGHFTADDLAGLTLFALGTAVVAATVIASMFAFVGVQDGREQAKRERMRQDAERHHR